MPDILTKLKFSRNGHSKVFNREELEKLSEQGDDESVLCGIIFEKKGTYEEHLVKLSDIPEDSIQGYYKGTPFHLLCFNGHLYTPFFPTEVDPSDRPQALTGILKRVRPLVGKVFKGGSNLINKIKIGILIFFCFAEIAIIFFIIAGQME